MIISIASGKGGTGKTLVATSFALSLKDTGSVQLIDCDVEEPNAHIFVKPDMMGSKSVSIPIPRVDEAKCTYCCRCAKVCAYNAIAVLENHVLTFPQLCHGCGACSYLCPENAISEESREVGVVEWGQSCSLGFAHGRLTIGESMAPPIIRKLKEYADNSGITIIDVPPGTSCPVVEAVRDSDFCLLVTEPTPFGINDLALAVEMIRELDIPCSVILNRAGIGNNRVEEYCHKEEIPILLTIPLDNKIARVYSRGIPLVQGFPQWEYRFLDVFNSIKRMVDERNSVIKR